MPFKSKAQQRWMFSQKPEMAKEWADHTPDFKKLPERVEEKTKEKKGFCHMDAIAGFAKAAADDTLVIKLAEDTQITPELVRHLADKVSMPVSKFVKMAYADPAAYTIFLKLASGVIKPNQLTKGAADASGLISKILGHLQNGASAVGKGIGNAAKGAVGAKDPTHGGFANKGGIFGTSKGSGMIGRGLQAGSPLGQSTAGRAATVGAGGGIVNAMLPGGKPPIAPNPEAGPNEQMLTKAVQPAAPAAGANPAAQAGGAAGSPQAPSATNGPAANTPEPGKGGLSNMGKGLLAAGGVGAGALGIGAAMRNRKKKKEVTAHDVACDVMRSIIIKKAVDAYKKTAADQFVGYLDSVVKHMSFEKTAQVRKLQSAVIAGKPLSHAIKFAYPHLNGEQRGILASNMVKGAVKHAAAFGGKKANPFKSSGRKDGTMKVKDMKGASEEMDKFAGDKGMTKQALPAPGGLWGVIQKNKGLMGLLGGVGAAGAGAGLAGRMMGGGKPPLQSGPGGVQPGANTPIGKLNTNAFGN